MPPGRPVGRPPKRKTVAGTGAARSRRSDNHADIPNEGEETVLRRKMARLFSDAQNSIATQRNLAGQLRKIQVACCFDRADGKRTEFDHFTEEDFTHEFLRCTWRILAVKKAEHCADKLVRFLGVFLKNASAEGRCARLEGEKHTGTDPGQTTGCSEARPRAPPPTTTTTTTTTCPRRRRTASCTLS